MRDEMKEIAKVYIDLGNKLDILHRELEREEKKNDSNKR